MRPAYDLISLQWRLPTSSVIASELRPLHDRQCDRGTKKARERPRCVESGRKPAPGFARRVFIHDPIACADGRAAVVLHNAELREDRGLALAIRFDPAQLRALHVERSRIWNVCHGNRTGQLPDNRRPGEGSRMRNASVFGTRRKLPVRSPDFASLLKPTRSLHTSNRPRRRSGWPRDPFRRCAQNGFICQMIGEWSPFYDAGISSGSSWSSPFRSGSHGCQH